MALQDIVFNEGDPQNFVLEIHQTLSNTVLDIVGGSDNQSMLTSQLTLTSGVTSFAY